QKILQLQPTPDEKTQIQEAQLANPDIPLGTAEQFLLTMASISELTPRLHLWLFKLDYDLLEKEVAEPLMDLKEALEEINKNITFKHILATLLAIGNFLNGKQVKGFQLDYLSKVPEVKDTVHKQSLLYHLCCMVMDKFPNTTDLYSELGACHRSSRVDFDIVAENLKKLKENCKKSWEYLSIVAKHDSTKQLKSKMSELLTDAQERITILKVVHRRVMNRFRKMLLYLGVSPSLTKRTKVNEFCKIISEFSLEYRTTREKVLEQKKKRENIRERNRTRGKLITESFRTTGRSPSEERVEEALHKALFSNDSDQLDSGRERLKSNTLPNSRGRLRSNRSSLSHDEFP
ncbi:FH1/FH2 domain-containing protein 3, partial [Exaiptasia diaphana]